MAETNPELKMAEGGAWSSREMLQRGMALDELARLRRRFQLAYWRDRFGGCHYPKWQFDRAMKVLPAVAEILALFRTHDTMRVLSWFVQPVAHRGRSLLDLIRSGQGKRAVAVVRREEQRNASIPPFSKEALAELHRRVRDFEDPRRYVIATCWTRKHAAFFDVKRGVYAVDEITQACLFRRQAHAESVAMALDRGKPRAAKLHWVVAVRETPQGTRLLEGLPDPFDPKKRFKPRLRSAAAKPPLLVSIAPTHTRGHIVEGFLFALEQREAVVGLVAHARSRTEAKRRLMRECLMSPTQADAVLELRWWHFTRAAYRKYEAELRGFLSVEESTKCRPPG